jgi:hypothetical protein
VGVSLGNLILYLVRELRKICNCFEGSAFVEFGKTAGILFICHGM